MRTLKFLCVATASLTLGACSVWQNASRKYLEKSSYDFAGLKLHEKLIGCAAPNADASWREVAADDRARTLTRTNGEHFELRVEPAAEHGDVACDYAFASDDERGQTTDAAVADALARTTTP